MNNTETLEKSEPKQLGNSRYYTQRIWDNKNKKGYIAILSKKADGTFTTIPKEDTSIKEFMAQRR